MASSSPHLAALGGKEAQAAAMPSIKGAAPDEMLHYPRFVSALLATAPEKAAAQRPPARRTEPQRSSRRAGARAGRPKPSRRFVVLAACIAVVALVEGFLAYRSSQTAWVFDSPDAQKRHQVRNSWTGEYSFGK
jgi:hypothetical protein